MKILKKFRLANRKEKLNIISDFVIQFTIVISLLEFSISTLPNLDESMVELLNKIELIIVSIFTLEYIIRLFASKKKTSFIFSFYGFIDLIAILPFYLSSGFDLTSIRVFRLFRLFKLFKYNKNIKRFKNAFKEIKDDLILFFSFTLILLFISSVGIYYCESEAQPDIFSSVFHCLWWSLATLTTVGYGDIYPITIGGKIFTFFILMIGVGIISIPSGLIASALFKNKS